MKLLYASFQYSSSSGEDPGFPKKGFICIKVCVCGGGGANYFIFIGYLKRGAGKGGSLEPPLDPPL